MKTNSWLLNSVLFVLVMCVGCHRSSVGVEEVPKDIIESVPCPTLYTRILELFPEHRKATDEVLFADSVEKRVILKQQSDVYVTFIYEGAGYRNTFGWYSYNVLSPPSSAESLVLTPIFPNVSNNVLNSGDKIKIGNFPAGTVVGFFLIVDGWQNDHIDFARQKVYTDINLNPNGEQQHILFEEKTCGDIVLAFEDVSLDGTSDKDYNDILFTVSDNNSQKVNTAFDITNIVKW
ncbi:MAG: DUF4114 domain-containing protein [Bacteroidota bacterium]